MAASEQHTEFGLGKCQEEEARSRIKENVGNLDFGPMAAALRREFESGKTKDLSWRREQLKAIQRMVQENHLEITTAVRADLGGPKLRGIADLGSYEEAQNALDKLEEWTAPEKVATPFTVSPSRMGHSYIRMEPKGVALIIAPWNFPFQLCLEPLVSAIAAGCCVVLKPSEIAPNSADVIDQLVNKYLDTSCIKVVKGAVATTTGLLNERWDHIFYTGNGQVARIVSKAAAEHLTTVTLELGGKSPVIVDKSAKMQTVIDRVSAFKWLNAGQICIAPDYVLVHKSREQEFVEGMKKKLIQCFGQDPSRSGDWGRVINKSHVRRVANLVDHTKGTVEVGGLSTVNPEACYFPPTIVRAPELGEPLMTEEIFGPVLAVVTFDKIEDAIFMVNRVCDRPLALYVFSEDKAATAKVLDNTNSGGVCINSVLEHVMNKNLPFGGTGASGHGASHGKYAFDEFTHKRAVLHQDTLILKSSNLPPPPYKDAIYDIAVKATITGFLTEGQRKLAKTGAAAVVAGMAGLALRSRL